MKLCSKILAIAIAAATTFFLIGCTTPASFSYQNISISITPFHCGNCTQAIEDPVNLGAWEVNGALTLIASANNAPPNFTWSLYPQPNLFQPSPPATGTGLPVGEQNLGPTLGYFDYVGNSLNGPSVEYIPPSPTIGAAGNIPPGAAPVYFGPDLLAAQSMQYTITYNTSSVALNGTVSTSTHTVPTTGIPQGDVLLGVSVPSNPDDPTQMYTAYQLIEIYGTNAVYMTPRDPTNPSGLTDIVLTVPRGTTYQFYGGAVGVAGCGSTSTCNAQPTGLQALHSIDNTVVWEVGSSSTTTVIGGSTQYGTISTSGLYTAPTVSPTGTFPFTTCVLMAAHVSLSTNAYAYITVN
jgi:hypothetical protein